VIKDRATGQRMMLYLNSTKGNGEKHDKGFCAVFKQHYCSSFILFYDQIIT